MASAAPARCTPLAEPYDACVIGHVVLDRNRIGGVECDPCPGGAAYYAGVAFARLGLRTAVVTRVAEADAALLLGELLACGVSVHNLGADRSTIFRNLDSPDPAVVREQRVEAEAPPIAAADLPPVAARVFHLGPLTRSDLAPDVAPRLAGRGRLVALDVQGRVRRIERGLVRPHVPAAVPDLASIDVLKADDSEILTYTGRQDVVEAADAALAAGAGEVIITKADRGSMVLAGGELLPIPAYRPVPEVDPTGCGDTYLAAYLAFRLESDDQRAAGLFAAAAAAIKMQDNGPFRADRAQVEALQRSKRFL